MYEYELCVIVQMSDKSASMMQCRVLCILFDELMRRVI